MLIIVASNLPDADVLFGLGGRDLMVFSRHGITHSLFGAVVLASLLAWVFRAWTPEIPFRLLLGFSLAATLVHIAMDLAGATGTAILAPFSWHRYSLNWVATIDPWSWGILAIGLAAGLVVSRSAVAMNRGAMVFLLVYFLLCGASHSIALTQFREILVRLGVKPERVVAFPQAMNPLRWNAIGFVPGRYYQGYVNSLGGMDGRLRAFFHNQVPESVAKDGFVARYKHWAAAPLVRAFDDSANPGSVALCDLRFLGRHEGMPFVAKINRDGSGVVRHVWLPSQVTPPVADQEFQIPRL